MITPTSLIRFLLAMLAVAALGFAVGYGVIRRESDRSDAIKAGVAHYTVNPTTGETKFEWIKPEDRK
jgi:hypothetical protein